jgi:hypothetical protein
MILNLYVLSYFKVTLVSRVLRALLAKRVTKVLLVYLEWTALREAWVPQVNSNIKKAEHKKTEIRKNYQVFLDSRVFKEKEATRETGAHLVPLLMSRARRENLEGLVLSVWQEAKVTWDWMDYLVCLNTAHDLNF